MTITEADRATARRVLSDAVGYSRNGVSCERVLFTHPGAALYLSEDRVVASPEVYYAAVEAAAQGRAYAAALRSAK